MCLPLAVVVLCHSYRLYSSSFRYFMIKAQDIAKGGTKGSYLVIYACFSSYFIAECFMHHVNLCVIMVSV